MINNNPTKQFSAQYLYVAVFTTATVILWIGFEVFRSLTTPAVVPQVTPIQLEPLSGEIDIQAIGELKQRLRIDQESLDNLEVTPVVISAMTRASESATIEIPIIGEEASKSGGI